MSNIRASIDIGNGYIKGILFSNEEGRDIIISKQITKTEGYRKGKILDSNMLAETIHTIVEELQRKLGGEYIDDVIIGISHPELIIERVSEHKRILGNTTIQSSDVSHLSKLIADISEKNNYEIININPAYWILDDEKIEKNPEGSDAKKLTMVADVFYLPKVFYQHLFDIFHTINLNVIDIIPNILSSSEHLLDIDHKDLGSILIDIGANQTSYAVFEEGNPLLYGTLPVGGDEISKDISIGLQIDIKQAEYIKTNYEQLGEDHENMRLDHKFLHEIISARYEQIFEKINDKLKKIKREGKLAGGVHLTGQGSLWPESIAYARDIFKLAVFPAQGHEKYRDLAKDPAFQNTLSLYEWANKYHNKNKGIFSFRGFQSIQSGGKGIFESIVNFFKELF